MKEEKDNKRVIHMIPHSHTDEGWLSTSDEFFSGDDVSSIYVGGVKDMLDSVVQQLLTNKNRTFTFAETKYFKMWYEKQSDFTKNEVKRLVKSGRLDLVGGGWSAPDEALTTYDAILDNFMIGQQFLVKEFNHSTKISWQVDAFGVS